MRTDSLGRISPASRIVESAETLSRIAASLATQTTQNAKIPDPPA
jgi:hypothetical protein